MTISFISHPDCSLHEMGKEHPENPARLSAIQDLIHSSGLDMKLDFHEAPLVSREQLCRVHDPDYIEDIFLQAPKNGYIQLDPDTRMNRYTLPAALRAAGAAVHGVDLVMSGKNNIAFCSVRPPGHHAERKKAMGFCIFNNVAVGAAHAIQAYNLKKVAIVDFDVHHGNGTEDIFRNTPEILFCSTFQHPLYPYRGADTVSENIVNVPLFPESDSQAFRDAVELHWLPRLEEFQPELILISAGFDAHVDEEIASLCLVEDDFAWVTHKIKSVANKYAKGRIISLLEGGYNLPALGRSVVTHLKALLD